MKRIIPVWLFLALACSAVSADSISTSGAASPTGPCGGDLSGTYPNCTVAKINGSTPASVATSGSASDLSAGTVPAGRMPALTGDCTTSAGAVATLCPGMQRRLGVLKGANFNTTSDQAIAIVSGVTAFQLTSIVVTNCSASLTLAVGGFYPAASKAGTPIVAATQVYSAASAATVVVNPTIAATPLVTRYTLASMLLSLTVAQGSAATCDVYLFGVDLT